MKKDYKILILGCANSIYIINFIKFLKRENPLAKIYLWGPETNSTVADDEFYSCLEECYFFNDTLRSAKIPYVRRLERMYLWKKHFRNFIKTRNFDIVNIHFVSESYTYIMDSLNMMSSKVVLSPWGSDVYRIGNKSRTRLMSLYKNADYVSGVDNRFTKDVMSIFNVPESKIAYFDLGSSTIDYIIENKNKVTTEQAKSYWGVKGSYTITCGYNASPAQQHLKVIQSIAKIKDQLPNNLTLLFPFTYNGVPEYRSNVKKACKDAGIKAVFFENFLELPDLFRLRKATDMFIHVQTTDANSTSFGEYLLCGKKIINGSWLRYDELEFDGNIPYFVVQDIEKLEDTILKAYHANKIAISEHLLKILKEKSCTVNAQRANSVFEKIS
jgi:hypothetical protein